MLNTETNELVLVKNVMPALISFNYEELEKALNSKLEDFQNLIVTEDTLKGAKSAKKELAGLRNDLDAFRKAAKKEAEKPIKDFETKIKKLITLVEETEKPLDDSISVYDDKVREEKRSYAKKLIQDAISSYALRPEYAARMILKDEYANLSGTKKAVKESISKQAELLKQEQDSYDSNLNIINTAIENENKRLKVKLRPEKFTALLNSIDTAEILSLIKDQAYDIYQQENPKEDVAVDVTSLFTPDSNVIDNDTNVVNSDNNDKFVGIPGLDEMEDMTLNPILSNDVGDVPTIPDCFVAPSGLNVTDDFIPAVGIIPTQDMPQNTTITPMDIPSINPNDWKCVFEVTGDFSTLRELNAYMKEHGINFKVISQEKMTNIE